MAKIKLFKLRYCGFCREALRYLEDLQNTNPAYRQLDIEIIDEAEQRRIANAHDYYYVPTFYMDDVKIHEGPVCRADVESILRRAVEKGRQS
ncbi:MAG TPA: thioredoxin family protein [Clostridiales bacterium]|nr:thioredoxin family protein [Clostridiales bacterium]